MHWQCQWHTPPNTFYAMLRNRYWLTMALVYKLRAPLRAAVTLVELLIVVAIIGTLVAILLPAIQSARESARRSHCQNNLKQVGTALHLYHNARRELPVGCVEKRIASTKPDGKQHAWSSAILSHLEEGAVWNEIDLNAAYDASANRDTAAYVISTYICPSVSRQSPGRELNHVSNPVSWANADSYRGAAIDYGGIYGAAQMSPSANGVFLYDRSVKLADVTDGTSHTLAVAEDSGRGWLMNGEWINGENIYDVGGPINRQQDNEIWSDHPGGAIALWCDGSVQFMNEHMETSVLRAACSRGRAD